MAPESERATLESVCAYCRQTIHNVGKFGAPGKPDMWLHEDGTAYCKNTTATPTRPNDPTLTCSEVVERLPMSANDFKDEYEWKEPHDVTYHAPRAAYSHDELIEFAEAYAKRVLHSWRERRVQELEELLAKRSGCSHCNDSASRDTSSNSSTEIRRRSK